MSPPRGSVTFSRVNVRIKQIPATTRPPTAAVPPVHRPYLRQTETTTGTAAKGGEGELGPRWPRPRHTPRSSLRVNVSDTVRTGVASNSTRNEFPTREKKRSSRIDNATLHTEEGRAAFAACSMPVHRAEGQRRVKKPWEEVLGDEREATLSFTDPCNVRTVSSICTLQSRVLLKSRRSLYKL